MQDNSTSLHVLCGLFDYEGATVLGVFDEHIKAVRAMMFYKQKGYYRYVDYEIKEFPLNGLDIGDVITSNFYPIH